MTTFNPHTALRAVDLNAAFASCVPLAGGDTALNVTATGSSTARTLAARFADTVNIRDFGAVGDGTTDDTAAFASAAASGLTIFVPNTSSFYKITGTISPVSGTVFAGARARPTIKMVSGSVGRIFDFNGVSNAGLQNLTLDGNKAVTPANSTTVRITSSTRCFVDDCYALNWPSSSTGGLVFSGTANRCRAARNTFDGYAGTGVGLTGASVQFIDVVDNEFVSGGTGFGIRVGEGANRFRLSGNFCLTSGIELIGITLGCNYGRVFGNHAEGTGDNGISISGDHTTCFGNVTINNANAGVGVWGSRNTITGNVCVNNNQSLAASHWSGVWVDSGFGGFGGYNTIVANATDDNQASPTQYCSVLISSNAYAAWAAGQTITVGLYRFNGLNLYKASSAGTTGSTAPVHTSGTVSDGGVSWDYVNTAQASTGPTRNTVMGNTPGRNLSGTTFNDSSAWVNNQLYGYQDIRLNAGTVQIQNLVTSSTGLLTGTLWSSGGVINIK